MLTHMRRLLPQLLKAYMSHESSQLSIALIDLLQIMFLMLRQPCTMLQVNSVMVAAAGPGLTLRGGF